MTSPERIQKPSLSKAIEHAQVPIDTADERAIQIAQMYAEFPHVKDASQVLLDLLERKRDEYGEAFVVELQRAMREIRKAAEIVLLSLDSQENLVDHRWMRDTASLSEALEKGRRVIELDIRLDADGQPWVSHAIGARASFLPPYIEKMSTQEMQEKSARFPLEEGLQEFSRYMPEGHRLLLELKTLGPDAAAAERTLQNLKTMLRKTGTYDAVAIASLSPNILMESYKRLPDIPLICNAGILPVISSPKLQETVERILLPDKKWRAVGIPGIAEMVLFGANETIERPDGHGMQSGYLFTRIPNDLVEAFREQRTRLHDTDMGRFAGVISITWAGVIGNVLDALPFGVGSEKATMIRKYYADAVDALGLGKMATTWGQELGKIPGLSHLQPQRQLEVFRRDLGEDGIAYTKRPEEWAHTLPTNKK